MQYKILLIEGPALWRAKLLQDVDRPNECLCVHTTDEAERKGLAHQLLIDYCLAQGLDHTAMKIELLRWEGC